MTTALLRTLRLAALAYAVLMSATAAQASERASMDEAKSLASKAAAFLKDNLDNPQRALDAFTSDPAWQDRELYVAVRLKDGTSAAHPMLPAMVGKKHLELKDQDGKAFVRDIVSCPAECWVEYRWRNHTTGAIEHKSSYVVAVGDFRVLVGSYQP